jgi:hypothetical protein
MARACFIYNPPYNFRFTNQLWTGSMYRFLFYVALILFLVKHELSSFHRSSFLFLFFYFLKIIQFLEKQRKPSPLSCLNLGLGFSPPRASMDESKKYTRWEEVVVSTDKGKREVHYYLIDSCGNSDLAVVGRERSLRHMTYETVDGFVRSCHLASPSPHCSPLTDGSMALKWKTRRDVVDWLSSLVLGNL